MAFPDYVVLIIYAFGMLFIGAILSRWNKTSNDMFAVSRQSSWWLSGISAFMSAFSAGTFVVWGGIAYKNGLVSVSILMSLGISSFIVGKFLAGRWAKLGVSTAGEYIRLRYGEDLVQLYTWAGVLLKFVAMSVALYAFAVLFSTLIVLPEGNFMRDAATGHLSITWACIISGVLMLFYTVSGGLWAILIIDAVQFVVLTVTVLFVVPLSIQQVGGIGSFIEAMPDGFLFPAGGKFTFWFLAGWIVIHVFKLGGEWVFIQRFLSVNSPRAAQKSSYLVGALYLICPIVWMLPAMLYRVIEPGVNPEQAYFLACISVLPAGMVGLLLASMFSAAASAIGGEINVYAGALTKDVYKSVMRPDAGEKELVLAGRVSAILFGASIITGAALIPYVGGAENVILTLTSLLVVPLALPSIWGLFMKRIDGRAVWCCILISYFIALVLKILTSGESSNEIIAWLSENSVAMEVGVGVFVPMIILTLFELAHRKASEGSRRIENLVAKEMNAEKAVIATFPAKLLAHSMGALALVVFMLAFTAGKHAALVIGFGVILVALDAAILVLLRRNKKQIS